MSLVSLLRPDFLLCCWSPYSFQDHSLNFRTISNSRNTICKYLLLYHREMSITSVLSLLILTSLADRCLQTHESPQDTYTYVCTHTHLPILHNDLFAGKKKIRTSTFQDLTHLERNMEKSPYISFKEKRIGI